MTRDRWLDIKATIKDKFTILEEGTEAREEGPGQIEFIEFDGPLGRLRCEYESHPKIIGKRALGGHKVGVGGRMKYEYDPHEETATFTVWKFTNGDWEELQGDLFS